MFNHRRVNIWESQKIVISLLHEAGVKSVLSYRKVTIFLNSTAFVQELFHVFYGLQWFFSQFFRLFWGISLNMSIFPILWRYGKRKRQVSNLVKICKRGVHMVRAVVCIKLKYLVKFLRNLFHLLIVVQKLVLRVKESRMVEALVLEVEIRFIIWKINGSDNLDWVLSFMPIFWRWVVGLLDGSCHWDWTHSRLIGIQARFVSPRRVL